MTITPLPTELYEELRAAIRGPVYLRGDPNFQEYATIFNGNVVTMARAVSCPLDADDVSKILVFCSKHGLSPSVKAGGYGTAGWAVGGDIVLDLSKLVDIDIEPPNAEGSFTSLRDMTSLHSKGKQPAGPITSSSGKRRREDDDELRKYDSASLVVSTFLCGSPLSSDNLDLPPPIAKRRVDQNPPVLAASEAPREVLTDSTEPQRSNVASSTSVISRTPSSGCQDSRLSNVTSSYSGDPFGYLDAPTNPPLLPTITRQSTFPPNPPVSTWTSGASTLITNPNLPSSSLNMVTPLIPLYTHAYVTFGAGMRQKEIDIYTANHPLEATSIMGTPGTIPYHVPFAAHPVGSSIMLLGGFGFLGRLHGLSIDNLVEVEVVLADGRIVIVNERDYPDLWWALRGGGPAFGVVTRYKAKAYPVPVVFAGNLIYRFHMATAPSLIKHFRDCIKGAPRELYANILLTAGPAGKDSLVVIQMCYVGPKEKGQEFLAAISSWDGERCLLNEVDEKSFLHQQDSVAQVLRGKAGRQWFIRSALISSLPDEIVNQTVLQFANTPVGCTWLFELAGGAITDYEDTCVPKSQREASFTVAALHQWEMGLDDPRCITTAEDWIQNTLRPVQIGGPFPSFLGRHEPAERTIACFGSNWPRLKEIKQLYDPKNLFRNTFWPLNAAGEIVDPRVHEPPTPDGANQI